MSFWCQHLDQNSNEKVWQFLPWWSNQKNKDTLLYSIRLCLNNLQSPTVGTYCRLWPNVGGLVICTKPPTLACIKELKWMPNSRAICKRFIFWWKRLVPPHTQQKTPIAQCGGLSLRCHRATVYQDIKIRRTSEKTCRCRFDSSKVILSHSYYFHSCSGSF